MKRFCLILGLAMMGAACCLTITGCAGLPAWLSEANQLLPVFLASAGSILASLGAISGNPAYAAIGSQLAKIGTDIEAGIKTVQEMVAAYQANPGETTLQNVENAAQAVISSIQALMGDFGLPAAMSAPYVALAQLLLTQFETWVSAITSIKQAVGSSTGVHAALAAHAMIAHLNAVPMTPAQFKAAFNTTVADFPNSGATTI